MWELPTRQISSSKNTQDFNQTTHVGLQDPSVFTDNISFYFYSIISTKKLNERVMQITSFRFQNHVVFKFQNFLFSVVMRLLFTVMGRDIGKPNCHLTSIKLSTFLTMFMLNFVTVTIPVLFR